MVSAIGAVFFFSFLVVCCDRDCFDSCMVRFFVSILLYNLSFFLFFFELNFLGRFSLPAPAIVTNFLEHVAYGVSCRQRRALRLMSI